MKERYWTTPMESESGRRIMVTGRDHMEKIMEKGKHPNLIRVSWRYNQGADGFPDAIDSKLMEEASDLLEETFRKDPVAYLVAITTGDGEREWLFYAGSLPIFGKVFNRALEGMEETLPLEITAESDPEWEAYKEIREATYIPESPEETE